MVDGFRSARNYFFSKEKKEQTKNFINKRKTIIILIAAVIVAIYLNKIIFITKNFFDLFVNINGGLNVTISDRIYLLTLFAIIWYAYETKLLREITFGRPVISIIKNVTDTIEIRNDGSNIAYNINISFLYDGRKAAKDIRIAILGKGLLYKVGISNRNIRINGNIKKLSALINASPVDGKFKLIVDYSDSFENRKKFRDKWKLDETILMSSSNEGRFRLIYSKPS